MQSVGACARCASCLHAGHGQGRCMQVCKLSLQVSSPHAKHECVQRASSCLQVGGRWTPNPCPPPPAAPAAFCSPSPKAFAEMGCSAEGQGTVSPAGTVAPLQDPGFVRCSGKQGRVTQGAQRGKECCQQGEDFCILMIISCVRGCQVPG